MGAQENKGLENTPGMSTTNQYSFESPEYLRANVRASKLYHRKIISEEYISRTLSELSGSTFDFGQVIPVYRGTKSGPMQAISRYLTNFKNKILPYRGTQPNPGWVIFQFYPLTKASDERAAQKNRKKAYKRAVDVLGRKNFKVVNRSKRLEDIASKNELIDANMVEDGRSTRFIF